MRRQNFNRTPLSNEEYLEAKKNALANEPVTRVVKLSEIELKPNSYQDGFIRVGNNSVTADTKFFHQLADMLDVKGKMRKTLIKGLGETGRSKGSDKDGLFAKMVETMKHIKATAKQQTVTLIGNPANGHLIGATMKPYSRIPNANLFEVAEQIIGRNKELSVCNVTDVGGGLRTNILIVSEADIPFLPVNSRGDDETFNFGITLNNDETTNIGDCCYRQVCSNGMMGFGSEKQMELKGVTPEEIRRMFEYIEAQRKVSFVPRMFEENMKTAGKTTASYGEVEEMLDTVIRRSFYDTDDDVMYEHDKDEIVRTFFQGYVSATARMLNKNIDPLKLSKREKSVISSGQNMWDAINSLTWLGSHDSGYSNIDQIALQKAGGKWLGTKEFDLATIGELMKL